MIFKYLYAFLIDHRLFYYLLDLVPHGFHKHVSYNSSSNIKLLNAYLIMNNKAYRYNLKERPPCASIYIQLYNTHNRATE